MPMGQVTGTPIVITMAMARAMARALFKPIVRKYVNR